MHDLTAADALIRHLCERMDDAATLEALDELAAQLSPPDPPRPRTREERAAERAARDDWNRAGAPLPTDIFI